MLAKSSVFSWISVILWFAPVARSQSGSCPAQNATEWALEYGFPLLSFEKAFVGAMDSGGSANQMIPGSRLATPQDTAVVKPNVDTLYSRVFYDLSKQDLVFDVPAVNDSRYYALSFYTPYGDNYLNLGPVDKTPPGKYLLTMTPSSSAIGSLSTNSSSSGYQGVVYSPTTFGIALYRILLRNTSTDLPVVRNIQSQLTCTSIPRNGSAQGPSLDASTFAGLPNSSAEAVMELNARFAPTLPFNTTGDGSPSTTTNFSEAGISGDTYTPPGCVNLSAAWTAAQQAVLTFPKQPGSLLNSGNGWFINNPQVSGLFGANLAGRAYIAAVGYLMLQSSQALYPMYTGGNLSLTADESYVLHFSGKPALTALGFWSLTMYSADSYLVDNPIDRYALGDRSNLTYPDGKPVYSNNGSSGVEDGDGPFDILVQAHPPPDNWTSNWLPSPAQPGPFLLTLRWYVPEKALSNGSYVYPVVTKGGAIVANGTSQPSPSPVSPSSSSSSSSATGSGSGSGSGSSPTATGSAGASGSAASPTTSSSAATAVSLQFLHGNGNWRQLWQVIAVIWGSIYLAMVVL